MAQREEKAKKKWLSWLTGYKYVILLAVIGVICLLWPGGGEGAEKLPTENKKSAEAESLESLRSEMETILSGIDGVGQLKLMLTVDSGVKRILAEDTSLSYSGVTNAPDDYSRTSQPVVISGDGADEVVVTKEVWPTFRGALVVCQGAENPQVKLAVLEAVSALTGLGSDRISVIKGQ